MTTIDAFQSLAIVCLAIAVLAAYVTDWDDLLGHPRYGPRRPMSEDVPPEPPPQPETPKPRRRRGGRR